MKTLSEIVKEILLRLQTAQKDCTSYEYVELMLMDWKDELEKLKKRG